MGVLIAEDLLLLLLNDHRGDLAVRDAGGPPTGSVLAGEAVLGGAVLLELDLAGAVQLRGTPDGHEVVVTPRAFEPGGVTGDPVLRGALRLRRELDALDCFIRRVIQIRRLRIDVQIAARRQPIVIRRFAVPNDARLAELHGLLRRIFTPRPGNEIVAEPSAAPH